MNVLRFKKPSSALLQHLRACNIQYIHHVKGGKWKLAVKSQYDEILHDKIYLRINKS